MRFSGQLLSLLTAIVLVLALFWKSKYRWSKFVAVWLLGLWIAAYIAPWLVPYQPSFPYSNELLKSSGLPSWIFSWANFDGVHYLTIVRQGYLTVGLIQAFFPLYPLLIFALSTLIAQPIIAGLAISITSAIILARLWHSLLKLDYSSKTAWLGLFALFLFPTTFYFVGLYTESLFLALVIGAFLAARRQRWKLTAVLIAAASSTRIVGIFLIPALVIELVHQQWPSTFLFKLTWASIHQSIDIGTKILTREWKKIVTLSLGSSGLIGYMLFLWNHFNDPLYFFHVQSEFGSGRQESLVMYPQVLWRSFKILITYGNYDLKYFAYFQEFVVGLFGILGLLLAVKKVRLSYVVFSLCAFLLPTLTGTFSSLPRYALASFALFILIAQMLSRSKVATIIWFAISTFFLVFNTILFIQGYWVA